MAETTSGRRALRLGERVRSLHCGRVFRRIRSSRLATSADTPRANRGTRQVSLRRLPSAKVVITMMQRYKNSGKTCDYYDVTTRSLSALDRYLSFLEISFRKQRHRREADFGKILIAYKRVARFPSEMSKM